MTVLVVPVDDLDRMVQLVEESGGAEVSIGGTFDLVFTLL
jgi:hypothetical protein